MVSWLLASLAIFEVMGLIGLDWMGLIGLNFATQACVKKKRSLYQGSFAPPGESIAREDPRNGFNLRQLP